MSNFSRFMKENKKARENAQFPATKSLLDENGEPMLWTIRPLLTKDNNRITEECMEEIPVTGKPNVFRPKLNMDKYLSKMLCHCIVYPELNNAELQDSYGVERPEDLLKEMIDDPDEYNALVTFVQNYSGIKDINEEVDEAKN